MNNQLPPELYPGRTIKESVHPVTRDYFREMTPCPTCGNANEDQFRVARIEPKLFAIQCQVCRTLGPRTCHNNGSIAFMRWHRWCEKLEEKKKDDQMKRQEFFQLHPKVSMSTGIHDAYTFGSGQLCSSGFWEHPDYEAAREWEKLFPKDAPCWPHTEEQLKEMGLTT